MTGNLATIQHIHESRSCLSYLADPKNHLNIKYNRLILINIFSKYHLAELYPALSTFSAKSLFLFKRKIIKEEKLFTEDFP